MRVLLTVHQFFPEYKAGTEVLTLSVAKELMRAGHQVHVYTGHPGEASLKDDERFDEYDYEGIHVYRFHHAYVPMSNQTSMIEIGYNNQLAVKHFKRIVQTFCPDIVHHFHLNRLGIGCIEHVAQQEIAQFFTPTDFWMVCPTAQLMLGEGRYCNGPSKASGNCIKHFARDSKGGVLGSVFDHAPTFLFDKLAKLTKNNQLIHYPMSNEVRAMAMRLEKTIASLNKLDGIVAPNKFMKDLFIRYGVNADIIHDHPFGIDMPKRNVEPKRNSDDRPLSLGFIGTLAPHKGCHIAIEAVKRLPKNSATLKIYGNVRDFPEYYSRLLALVGDNDAIRFCGTFPNEAIDSVMDGIDALIVPSIWYENTPLVIYSAQAAKCPVIGSDLPGIAEVIVHESNGLLFEAGNVSDLVAQVSYLLRNGVADLSKNAIKIKSIQDYVDALLRLWRN
ncbi:glycosyltransferase [Serratia nevei]|uniref:glycosyltransferase n=1 Tax=Serratia nevei TaxID=2703794 RepID=UPI00209E36E3|nr:glycosyltransferase [Serratia nevei]MCP1104971.1 glycosyltransferase [Serratia nevei]